MSSSLSLSTQWPGPQHMHPLQVWSPPPARAATGPWMPLACAAPQDSTPAVRGCMLDIVWVPAGHAMQPPRMPGWQGHGPSAYLVHQAALAGVCGGTAKSVDVMGACCPGLLDAGGLCCSSGHLDECGGFCTSFHAMHSDSTSHCLQASHCRLVLRAYGQTRRQHSSLNLSLARPCRCVQRRRHVLPGQHKHHRERAGLASGAAACPGRHPGRVASGRQSDHVQGRRGFRRRQVGGWVGGRTVAGAAQHAVAWAHFQPPPKHSPPAFLLLQLCNGAGA